MSVYRKWAYGITTVPERRDTLLRETIRSLAQAGFDRPRLFVDESGRPTDWKTWCREAGFGELEITARYPRIRTWGNWILGLTELYIREPAAEWYAMFQDDLVACKGLREYLEANPCPARGYMNLFTFSQNERVIMGKPEGAWYEEALLDPTDDHTELRLQTGRGAVALVFPRDGVLTLLQHQHAVERPMDAMRGWRAVDGGIVTAMNKARWRAYVHNPSLVEHTGKASTMGNPVHRGARTFKGEGWDVRELLPRHATSPVS